MRTKKQFRQLSAPRKMNHKFSRSKPGLVEIQTIGWSKTGQLVCAGVYYVPEISARIIYTIATSWRRWRKWCDSLPENSRLDYPAKGSELTLATYGAHPIDDPKAVKYVRL